MGKKVLAILFIGVAILGALFVYKNSSSRTPSTSFTQTSNNLDNEFTKEVDYTASFAIFTNGTFRIFTASMYHNLSGEVYIEASNPNVIHVKKERITWGDFFRTLPMSLSNDCLVTGTKQKFCTNDKATLKFYLNGEKSEDFLDKEIKPSDKALITYGSESEEAIIKQLERLDAIQFDQSN